MTFAVIDNEGKTAKAIAGTPFTEPEYTGKEYALDDVRLLAPTLPSKVVAVGRNYADHAKEMGSEVDREAPFYFLKGAYALVESGAVSVTSRPGDTIFLIRLPR